jgi:2,3-dihydroxybenzoate-AMP ligase
MQVAKFKWPERIEHLADIPRTLVGKTDKKRLQAEIAAKVAAELAVGQPRPAPTTPAAAAGGTQ